MRLISKKAAFFITAAFIFTAAYAAFAWQEPTQSPPNGNVPFDVGPWDKTGNDIYYTTGNVGIGTTSPNLDDGFGGAKGLQLSHVGEASIRLTRTDATPADFILRGGPSEGFQIWDAEANAGRLHISSAGNVGIGETEPEAPLHVEKEGNGVAVEIARFDSVGANDIPYITIGTTTVSPSGMFIGYDQVNNVAIIDRHSNQAATWSIAANGGNVGIGTTVPNEELEVKGGVRLNTIVTRPDCDVTKRGTLWFTESAEGDRIDFCIWDGSAYTWKKVSLTGG